MTAGLDPRTTSSGAWTAGDDTPAALAQADLIVGPWSALVAGEPVARAIANNPAPKVLLLTAEEDWHWAGAGKLKAGKSLRQAVRAVKDLVEEEETGSGQRTM